MKIGNLNVPNSWGKMSRHEKACYLANTFQAKNYADGIRLSNPAQPKAQSVPTVKGTDYWWTKY